GGGAEAHGHLRRPPDRGAGLRRARHRPGAPGMAGEGRRREHPYVEAARQAAPAPPVSFRDDGYAAVDWVARYLARVGELPVLAQVAPGALSAKLPESPPEQGEPFASVLRDLDELIVPALTNWQHPRFFAYFAVTASEP